MNAQQQQQEKPAVAKFADSVGLPTEEGLFGFKPFPEVRITRAPGLALLALAERISFYACCEALTGQVNRRYGLADWP